MQDGIIIKEEMGENVLCIGSMGKDVFLPTNDGVVSVASQGIKTKEQWAFGYGAKLHVEDRFEAPGGCACNVSVGLARLGIEASAYGIIADDADGLWIKSVLDQNDVDTQHIDIMPSRSSDLSMILVHGDTGERTIFVNRDIGEDLCLRKEVSAAYEWVFVGSLYGDTVRDNMRLVHDLVASGAKKLIYNPGMRNITAQPRTVLDLVHHAEILFVNKVEARAIVQAQDSQYNEEDLESVAFLLDDLVEQAGKEAFIVLTCGSRGAWLSHANEKFFIGTLPQDIVDATGAGDAFASGFVAGRIHGKDVSTCLQWGAANSHAVIAHYGGQKGLLHSDVMETESALFDVQVK